MTPEVKSKSVLKGGEWLIKESSDADIFIPENFSEEQIMIRDMCNQFLDSEVMPILAKAYGPENATKWWVYWRVFFMSCAELWGYKGGDEWFVSHYLFEKR